MRLIDLKKIPATRLDPDECLAGRMYACGWNGVIHALEEQPTIDPEDLPLVKELREQLAKVTAERDAAIHQADEIFRALME